MCQRVGELEFDKPILTYMENGHSGPGYYIHEEEYPEEGSVFVGKQIRQPQEQAHGVAARPHIDSERR